MLGGLVFGGLLSFGVVLYATEDRPSALFKEYCAKCHGEDGRADTPKGRQLMAQDMTDPEFQSEKTDAELIQIESLVKNDVRSFGAKKSK
jgi:mono/diheme cytochrome c family protein